MRSRLHALRTRFMASGVADYRALGHSFRFTARRGCRISVLLSWTQGTVLGGRVRGGETYLRTEHKPTCIIVHRPFVCVKKKNTYVCTLYNIRMCKDVGNLRVEYSSEPPREQWWDNMYVAEIWWRRVNASSASKGKRCPYYIVRTYMTPAYIVIENYYYYYHRVQCNWRVDGNPVPVATPNVLYVYS